MGQENTSNRSLRERVIASLSRVHATYDRVVGGVRNYTPYVVRTVEVVLAIALLALLAHWIYWVYL